MRMARGSKQRNSGSYTYDDMVAYTMCTHTKGTLDVALTVKNEQHFPLSPDMSPC